MSKPKTKIVMTGITYTVRDEKNRCLGFLGYFRTRNQAEDYIQRVTNPGFLRSRKHYSRRGK